MSSTKRASVIVERASTLPSFSGRRMSSSSGRTSRSVRYWSQMSASLRVTSLRFTLPSGCRTSSRHFPNQARRLASRTMHTVCGLTINTPFLCSFALPIQPLPHFRPVETQVFAHLPERQRVWIADGLSVSGLFVNPADAHLEPLGHLLRRQDVACWFGSRSGAPAPALFLGRTAPCPGEQVRRGRFRTRINTGVPV